MRYLFILLFLFTGLSAQAELRVIRGSNTVYAVDPARIIAIEPYIVYTARDNLFGRSTDDATKAQLYPDQYTPSIRGTRIILERRDMNVQMAAAGSGVVAGGDATNIIQPAQLILLGITPAQVIEQLYPKT